VNIVEIAPPPAIVLMQSPAASITLGNVCVVDPRLSSKSTHLSALDIVAELVGRGVNWLQKLQFHCSEADCKLRRVVGSVLNTALHGIRSNEIASCRNY